MRPYQVAPASWKAYSYARKQEGGDEHGAHKLSFVFRSARSRNVYPIGLPGFRARGPLLVTVCRMPSGDGGVRVAEILVFNDVVALRIELQDFAICAPQL